jgi:hypothetical protein
VFIIEKILFTFTFMVDDIVTDLIKAAIKKKMDRFQSEELSEATLI